MKRNKTIPVTLFLVITSILYGNGVNEMEGQEIYNLTYSGINKLAVEGVYFQLEVNGSPAETIDADIDLPGDLRFFGVKVLHKIIDSELRIWIKRPIPFFGALNKARMSFTVPEGIALDLKTNYGSIGIENIKGEMDLKTTSGRINILNSAGIVRAETASGRITMSEFTGAASLNSASGRLTGRNVELTGDSSFNTKSGSIEFLFINGIEDLTFQLSSVSGRMSAGGVSSKKNLVTGLGPIQITGRSVSGRQEYLILQ